jgi:hypothetical protein
VPVYEKLAIDISGKLRNQKQVTPANTGTDDIPHWSKILVTALSKVSNPPHLIPLLIA